MVCPKDCLVIDVPKLGFCDILLFDGRASGAGWPVRGGGGCRLRAERKKNTVDFSEASWPTWEITEGTLTSAVYHHRGDGELTGGSDCYKKPPSNSLVVGGLEVGISGIADIMERALERIDDSDEEVKQILLTELKASNYVPGGSEEEYVKALWVEYKKLRVQRREQLEMSFRGIPREEIPWYPVISPEKCTGCSSCADFCSQGVFKFDGKISHVVRPYSCVVGRSSCRSFCPEKAISFPTGAELRVTLRKLKEKHGLGK